MPKPLRAPLFVYARILFLLAIGATTFFTLWPPAVLGPPPQLFWDKAEHAMAFAILCLLSLTGFPRWPSFAICIGLAGYGGVIELVQSLIGRSGDWSDFVADTTGVLVGLAVSAILARVGMDLRRGAH